MRWEPTACQAGDMVRVRLGSVYHYGIFVSEDEVIQFGLPPTAENRAAEGEVRVLATDIDVFACGCIVETACLDRSEQRRRIPPSETVARARARLGESGYNLIHNTCEHFVNECVFGESRCTQEEDVRSRWLNRPICDVYVARIPEVVSAEGVYPEKRRAEIDSIVSEDLRRNARFLWQLLGVAAQHSF
ncbi:MAG: lecithin retinol acyltransferase family protein, partial [Ruminococcus sp.]|nr:lecithin retinol acyltransferase family protein [Ruminococcus sp.]